MSDSSNTWPISRSELVGRYRVPNRNRNILLIGAAVMLVGNIAVVFLISSMLQKTGVDFTIPFWLLFMASTPFLVLAISLAIWWRMKSRWEAEAPRIWDADGCICPWCKVDVRSEPCEAHGIDASHRDLLIAYYASPMLDNRAESYKRLVDAVPRPPRRTRLFAGQLGWFKRQAETIRDHDADPATRRRATINMFLMWYALLACIVAACILLIPNGMKYVFASGFTGWMLLMTPLFLLFNPVRIGPAKCKSCRQQCHERDQEICSECGADLRLPGAVTRKEWSNRDAVKAIPILIAIYVLPFMSAFIVGRLPAPARQAIWGTIGAPSGHFKDLDLATMTKTRAREEADLALHLARPNGPGIEYSFDSDFIAKALDLSLISDSYREDAARTTVSASILLEDIDDVQEIVLIPRIDRSLLGNKGPRLAFGGISIDEGPWSPGASWTLVYEDLDEWWRANASSRDPRPESQLTFRTPVDLEPGPHEIRARCWIVIDGYDWNHLDLTFDADGNPEFPAQAKVYDLPINTTVEVR